MSVKLDGVFHRGILGPAVAVDTALFSVINSKLSVLLIQVGSGPYEGKWALPGGLVAENESLDEAAKRLLSAKANVRDIYLEQLYTFGNPKRDSRGHVISVAYFSIVFDHTKVKPVKAPHYSDISWFPVNHLPKIAFDHKDIIGTAVKRIAAKMEYTNIAVNFLPAEFTLTELQKVYEIVTGKKLDKRNFRKKIDALDILAETNKTKLDQPFRPAKLFKFKERYLRFLD